MGLSLAIICIWIVSVVLHLVVKRKFKRPFVGIVTILGGLTITPVLMVWFGRTDPGNVADLAMGKSLLLLGIMSIGFLFAVFLRPKKSLK